MSAAPGSPGLVWAHAEYLKLAASRKLKRPFDRPDAVWQRYGGERPPLTITLREPGAVRWGLDGWQDIREQNTSANPLGVHVLERQQG